MTREEAKGNLIHAIRWHAVSKKEALDIAIKALEQEPKWIPVSERMPKDRKLVLVTAYWHETYQVMVGSYFGNGDWWCAPWNNTGEPQQLLKVIAWMPLPEPYKESEEQG